MLALLFGVAVLNMLDRQILGMLVIPIKTEFGVSDTAMGFLTGPSFALFYAVAGIPVARFADRSIRRSIIAAGLLLWSALTLATDRLERRDARWIQGFTGLGIIAYTPFALGFLYFDDRALALASLIPAAFLPSV